MTYRFGLQNKVAIITGAPSGLGAALARDFAQAGADVGTMSSAPRNSSGGEEPAGKEAPSPRRRRSRAKKN